MATEFVEVTIELRILKRKLATYTTPPEEGDEAAIFKRIQEDIQGCEKKIVELAINGGDQFETKPAQQNPHAQQSASMWRQSQMMSSYITSLNFTGKNEDEVSNLVTKMKAISKACPDISFIEIWSATQPMLPPHIIRSLAGRLPPSRS